MIIALTVVGVYSINNSMFDVWVMLGLGAIGYAMDKMSIPTAPAVLAVILGPDGRGRVPPLAADLAAARSASSSSGRSRWC